MFNLQVMTRVLYRHDWTSVDQWASSLDQLADLSDDEIDELERLGAIQSPWSPMIGDHPATRRRASEPAISASAV